MATFPNTPANPYNIIDVLGPDGKLYNQTQNRNGQGDSGRLLPGDDDAPPRMTDADWTDRNIGTYESILQYAAALPGFNEDALIQNRGYDEADRILQYAAYISPFSIMCDAVTWKTPEVIPCLVDKKKDPKGYEYAQENADFCRYLLANIRNPKTGVSTDFRAVIYYILDAIRVGFSVVEKRGRWYEDGPYKGKLGLQGFGFKEQRQVGFWLDRKTLEPLAINSFTPLDGYETNIPIEKFILYTFQPRKGLPYGWGTFRTAHRHVVCLDLLTKLWTIILERFGGGFLMGHFDNPKQKQMLLDAMTLMKRGAGVALPRGLEIVLEQMSGNGVESLSHAIDFHKRSITEIILGQSLTTEQGDKGSYAHASVHEKTQEFKMTKIRKDVEFILANQLFYTFIEFNFGATHTPYIPSYSLGVWDWDVIKMISDAMAVAVDHGIVGAKAPFLRQRLGYPPYDPEIEGELTLEPGRERLTAVIGPDGKPTAPPATVSTKQSPAQKPAASIDKTKAILVPSGALIMPGQDFNAQYADELRILEGA